MDPLQSEHMEVRNHPKAIEYIEKLTHRSLGERDILVLYQMIMKDIDKDAGRFRRTEVMIGGADFIPPPAYRCRISSLSLLNGIIGTLTSCGR